MLHWTVIKANVGPKLSQKWTLYTAAVAVGHKVYCFVGYDSNFEDQMSVRVFDTVALRWARLPLAMTTRGEPPSGRRWHTAVLVEDTIYVWGGKRTIVGRGNGVGYCNVLYAFDVDNHRWLRPQVTGTVPEARDYHSACVLRKVMYVYGGHNEIAHKFYNDIYKLDTTTMVWSLINTSGYQSSDHFATMIGTKMFVLQASPQASYDPADQDDDPVDSVSVFDTETECWLSAVSANYRTIEDSRAKKFFATELIGHRHSAFAYNGELYTYGELWSWDVIECPELWKFNPDTFSWKKIEPKGKGLNWENRMMDCCIVRDRVIFPGQSVQYILELSPSMKTLCKLAVMQYGLEQSGLPHNIRWELAAMTTDPQAHNY